MTILIDPPAVEGHGRLWSHLASDASFEELHAFARSLDIPERGFDRDHYDVPSEFYDVMIAAGATPVSSRELVRALLGAGLRRRRGAAGGPVPSGGPVPPETPVQPETPEASVPPVPPVPPEAPEASAGQELP